MKWPREPPKRKGNDMAKLIQQTVTVTFSQLVRDDDFFEDQKIVNEDLIQNIEDSLQALVSSVVLVEAKETKVK